MRKRDMVFAFIAFVVIFVVIPGIAETLINML